jgi:tetratricopeptide (TPR) repeat protein
MARSGYKRSARARLHYLQDRACSAGRVAAEGMMAQRTLPVNGLLVRSLREARGLTIEDAANQAGYSARTWQQLEVGNQAFRKTIGDVASVLGVPREVLVVDRSSGLRGEMEMFGITGLGSAVLTIDQTHLRVAAAELVYGLAILFDMSGEADAAAALCQALVAIVRDVKQRAAALIRLAAIRGHQGKHAEGLKLLDLLETELRAQKSPDLSLLYWTKYQVGVLLLGINRMDQAETILQKVADNAPGENHRTSARHQLGVVALRRGQYREAQRLFTACLKNRSAGSFRCAFEYRRLGEAYARDGRKHEAIRALKEAIRIARASGFKRYEQEVLRTASELDLIPDPAWARMMRGFDAHVK